jgi:hypothetical protein
MGRITRKRGTPPMCESCGNPLETAATTQNPSATIMPYSLARCPSCLVLFMIGGDLLPSPDLSEDEGAFNAAMNANPEIKQWAASTLEASRIRSVNEIKAEWVVAREWLTARGGPDLADDLATLDAYAAGFGEKGFTTAPDAIRRRASKILTDMIFHTKRH